MGSKSGIENDREEKLGILVEMFAKNFTQANYPSGFVFEAKRNKSKVLFLNLCFQTLLFFLLIVEINRKMSTFLHWRTSCQIFTRKRDHYELKTMRRDIARWKALLL